MIKKYICRGCYQHCKCEVGMIDFKPSACILGPHSGGSNNYFVTWWTLDDTIDDPPEKAE